LERSAEISVNVPHTASALEIYLTSDLDESADNESWGISNFVVEYVTEDACEDIADADACNEEILASLSACPLTS